MRISGRCCNLRWYVGGRRVFTNEGRPGLFGRIRSRCNSANRLRTRREDDSFAFPHLDSVGEFHISRATRRQ